MFAEVRPVPVWMMGRAAAFRASIRCVEPRALVVGSGADVQGRNARWWEA